MTDNPDIAWLKEGLARVENSLGSLSDKLDLYNDRFETKEVASRERERIEEVLKGKADKEAVQKIEQNLNWFVRIVISAVVMTILAVIGINI